ncbi:non-homologous end-joining DNA ligase [Nocardia callitridis]|uniref:DNA ligase (ATP) n=1 Tax=Nocardia callitridis TaxID=648753 RepID=A0ABP9K675_9NOCA
MLSAPTPMLATPGQPPREVAGWALEMKWDGIRAVGRHRAGSLRLHSRNQRDISGSFPDITSAFAEVFPDTDVTVDGEIVAPDPATGAPSFALLQRRMHVVRPTATLLREIPVQYLVFDLLEVNGESIMGLPYVERRRHLDALDLQTATIRTPPYYTDVTPATLLDIAREHDLEGILAKRLDSTYQPGRRCPTWIKTPLRRTTEVVVAGWVPGNGRFSTTFGSIAMGAYDSEGKLVYLGNVGTGWTLRDRKVLQTRLNELHSDTNPFTTPPPRSVTAVAHWVRPELVADVEYREATPDGLRHPSWRGLRTDKSAHEAKWESD